MKKSKLTLILFLAIIAVQIWFIQISSATKVTSSSLEHSSESFSPSQEKQTALSYSFLSFKGIKDFLTKGKGAEIARTFSSLRGSLSSPMTVLAYAGSLAVGAIVMLAFYESPISPLPVPPLPDPPVGRFPPEHPIWPPPSHTQVNRVQPAAVNGNHHNNFVHAASELRPVAVPHPNMIRRAGHEMSKHDLPHHAKVHHNPQAKPNQHHPTSNIQFRSKVPQKATKLNENPFNRVDLKPELSHCNGTICDQNANLTTSVSSSSLASKDKPQKLFDILMPRTSDFTKSTSNESSN